MPLCTKGSIRVPFALALSGSLALAGSLATSPANAVPGGNELSDIGVALEPVERLGLGSLSGYYLAARHAQFNQDIAAAAGFFAAALSKDQKNTDLLDSSVALNVASGNFPRAFTLAEELLRNEPDDWMALTTLAVDQIRKGERKAALETLGNLDEVGGQIQELVSALLQAWVKAGQGDADAAIGILDSLEGPSWYEPFTLLHSGLIADQAGMTELAGTALGTSYERDAGSPRVVDAYARALAREGKNDRADAVLGEFEARLGGSDQYTAGVRAALQGDTVEPLITSATAGAAEALYGLGTAYARDGGNAQAASLFQLAIYLDPENYFAAMALGQVMEFLRQHEAAIEIYRQIPESSPLARTARVQEALNLNALERNTEAIALLEEAVAADPSDVSTIIVLGNIFRSMEDFERSRATYTQAIETLGTVPPPYWTLFYYRGIARERTDDWAGAERDFRLALTYQPNNAHTLNYLGYSLIDRGEKLDEAIDMVRRAVAAEPSNGYIVDSLGWAYYRLGRYQDAVNELERAISLKPIDPVINDHLGDAYWQVGRKREALFQWSHAQEFGPDATLAAAIATKLANGLEAPEPVTEHTDASRATEEAPSTTTAEAGTAAGDGTERPSGSTTQ